MPVWREEALVEPEHFEAFSREALAAFPDLELGHDVAWQRVFSSQQRKLMVMTAREQGRLVGLAPFEVHPTSLQFGLGEVTVMRKRVQRFALERAPRVAGDADLTSGFFASLAERVPENGAVFLRGVAEGSETHNQLTEYGSALRKAFHVVPHGPSYLRCRILWDGSFERYLATLGKKTQKNLRQTLKKVDSTYGDRVAFARFSDEASIDDFLRAAVEVSAKTYQANLLGLGLARSKSQDEIRAVAARGSFLGFVLRIDGQPVAYDYGYVHEGRFYWIEGGYDPAWSKAQIGSYNLLRILLDLEAQQTPVTSLDYLYGENSFKERTSNMKTRERHYYLIKRGLRGTILASAMQSTDSLSRNLGALLERFELKEFIRRKIRQVSAWQLGDYKWIPFKLVPVTAVAFATAAIALD